MASVPVHPALVHVPLGLAFVLPILAAALAYAVWRGVVPRKTWIVVVALQALLVAGGAAALLTGDRDSERIERIVGEQAVDRHEDMAEAFVWGAGIVLAIATAALALPGRAAATATAIAAAGTFAVAGLGYRTGKAGGELVYAHGAAAAYAPPGTGASASAAKHRHPDEHQRRR